VKTGDFSWFVGEFIEHLKNRQEKTSHVSRFVLNLMKKASAFCHEKFSIFSISRAISFCSKSERSSALPASVRAKQERATVPH